MADVSVRGLDERVKERLRLRAAGNGRSMEAEIREILTEAVRPPGEPTTFVEALIAASREVGGVDLDIPRRLPEPSRVPDFGDPSFDR
ncbi:MAG: FitA-like ribbon-helix-helix domain-containing protein [Sporichthyaceae bacterium]